MRDLRDTIAAVATAPGEAGLAVVRVSGSAALAIADAVFRGARLADAPSHTLHHGWLEWNEVRVDEVVAAIFRAPRSYTREDVVEFSCHGGRLSAARALEAVLAAGARWAEPGEFTLRAFLNGRLDLVQAEAVADLIHAESESARALALGQLAGELSRRLALVRERVTDLLAEVEARVDFAEDVGGVEIPPRAAAGIAAADAELAALLDGAAYARSLREGVRMPLVGAPNAGKSSLFNALVGEERAIVAAEPGTTRDRVSEPVEIAGVRVLLSDTAGLREGAATIEAIGVARTREMLAGSARVLWVVDGSRPLESADLAVATQLAADPRRELLVALNKRDLGDCVSADEIGTRLAAAANGHGAPPHRVVEVSALGGSGVDALRDALGAMLGAGAAAGASVANPRHVEALGRAREALGRAAAAAEAREPGEILALELRESLAALGEVTGENVADDLLDRIFSRFCVGK